ncbi:hypothetical protein [Myroides sp.]|uniref:hypothetical protein n=1 Tax=Myroides sp. TaxID=1874736 RepID=UPI003F2BAA09
MLLRIYSLACFSNTIAQPNGKCGKSADQSMHSTSIYHTPLVLDKYSIEEQDKQEQEAAE